MRPVFDQINVIFSHNDTIPYPWLAFFENASANGGRRGVFFACRICLHCSVSSKCSSFLYPTSLFALHYLGYKEGQIVSTLYQELRSPRTHSGVARLRHNPRWGVINMHYPQKMHCQVLFRCTYLGCVFWRYCRISKTWIGQSCNLLPRGHTTLAMRPDKPVDVNRNEAQLNFPKIFLLQIRLEEMVKIRKFPG